MRVPCAAVPGVRVMKKSVPPVRLTSRDEDEASGSMEKDADGRG
jgi:hypothetical protein